MREKNDLIVLDFEIEEKVKILLIKGKEKRRIRLD